MKRATLAVVGCAALLTAGCTSQPQATTGGTFTLAVESDPGTLDPGLTIVSTANQLNRFLYDTLTKVDSQGETVQGLAEKWEATTTEAKFTLREGITCGDGAPLTATTVAENFYFVAKPDNASPLTGLFVAAGSTATADDTARTITITSGSPDAFLLRNLSTIPIVCQKGLADRSILKAGSDGTGMFTLKEAVANDRYVLTRREGYNWGPGTFDPNTAGLPDEVILRVIAGQNTSSSLLLSGEINAARGLGPDADRLRSAQLHEATYPQSLGQMFFNEAPERVTTDQTVRQALVQGVDLANLRNVMTGGDGVAPKGLVTAEPQICEGDLVTSRLPKADTNEAAAALEKAGWVKGTDGKRSKDGQPLTVSVLYGAGSGSQFDAAMEHASKAWTDLGVNVELTAASDAQIGQILDETGAWDVSFVNFGFTLPSQIVPFLTGPAAPDGLNSGHINNTVYQEHVALAAQLPGTEGCTHWNAAEAALYDRLDVVPFANDSRPWFGNKAVFELSNGGIVPTSIRMQSK